MLTYFFYSVSLNPNLNKRRFFSSKSNPVLKFKKFNKLAQKLKNPHFRPLVEEHNIRVLPNTIKLKFKNPKVALSSRLSIDILKIFPLNQKKKLRYKRKVLQIYKLNSYKQASFSDLYFFHDIFFNNLIPKFTKKGFKVKNEFHFLKAFSFLKLYFIKNRQHKVKHTIKFLHKKTHNILTSRFRLFFSDRLRSLYKNFYSSKKSFCFFKKNKKLLVLQSILLKSLPSYKILSNFNFFFLFYLKKDLFFYFLNLIFRYIFFFILKKKKQLNFENTLLSIFSKLSCFFFILFLFRLSFIKYLLIGISYNYMQISEDLNFFGSSFLRHTSFFSSFYGLSKSFKKSFLKYKKYWRKKSGFFILKSFLNVENLFDPDRSVYYTSEYFSMFYSNIFNFFLFKNKESVPFSYLKLSPLTDYIKSNLIFKRLSIKTADYNYRIKRSKDFFRLILSLTKIIPDFNLKYLFYNNIFKILPTENLEILKKRKNIITKVVSITSRHKQFKVLFNLLFASLAYKVKKLKGKRSLYHVIFSELKLFFLEKGFFYDVLLRLEKLTGLVHRSKHFRW